MSEQPQQPPSLAEPQVGKRPIKTFSAGRGIKVAIWATSVESYGRMAPRYSLRVEKRYCDEHGVWQDTNRLFVDDLPRVGLLMNKAYEWIVLKERDQGAGTPAASE